jgi:integrase
MRYRQAFTLYPRKMASGLVVYYYRIRDGYGQRSTGHSTGETTKTAARARCMELFRSGRLGVTTDPLFRTFAADWWVWESCPYIRGQLERGTPDAPKISRRYADEQRRILRSYLLPFFGKYHLSSIAPALIERFMFRLRDRGLSPKRVNNIVGPLRVMLGEAKRLGELARNPFDSVRPLAPTRTQRELLSLEEVRRLFAPEAIKSVWHGHQLYRAINMLAASTGLRLGEALALRDGDMHEGWLEVRHNWHVRYGLMPPKNRRSRVVPVPRMVLHAIEPFRGNGGFVFSFTRGERPATANRCTEALHAGLERMGIPRAEQRRRNLCFHSWRAWFNTVAQTRQVPPPLLRAVVGHGSEAMTRRYSAFSLEHFAPIVEAQKDLFP